VSEAVKFLVDEDLCDHIDLNFGCPVPKVTKKGGGAALPWKKSLFRQIVEGAVTAAGDIPVTVKMRKGIDDNHLTFIEAGKSAEGAGVASLALHARTASQYYSGKADWDAIGELKSVIHSIPVLGNGDIWNAEDALEMVRQSDCDGVVVGRGCLGRPWLSVIFRKLSGGARNAIDPVSPRSRRLSGGMLSCSWISLTVMRREGAEMFANMSRGISRVIPWAAICAHVWQQWSRSFRWMTFSENLTSLHRIPVTG